MKTERQHQGGPSQTNLTLLASCMYLPSHNLHLGSLKLFFHLVTPLYTFTALREGAI